MKRHLIWTITIVTAGFFLISGYATADPANTLNRGYQLNASETACPAGKKVLDVSYKLENSLDSGTGLNDFGTVWWAVVDYVLQVKVVQIDEDTYCATVKNQGSFESVGGDGPGCANDLTCGLPEGRLEAGVVGTFQGGYTMSVDSDDFNPDGLRTRGSIGKFDHDCDPSVAGGDCDGQGSRRWLSLYFPNSSFSYDWWGWVYHAGSNGTWVNSADGNEGNITGD